MTHEMNRVPLDQRGVRFAVVITDGHVTGNPCGGIKVTAERARDEGIRIFVVAASRNVDEIGLKEIANSPSTVFRNNHTAVDLSKGRAEIQYDTIDRIIKAMVTHRKMHTLHTVSDLFVQVLFICLPRNTCPT